MLLPDVTSTRPRACDADIAYSAGLIRPIGWCATWSASDTMPENNGVASLVPHVGYQPTGCPAKLWYRFTAPLQAPLIEMSGTPRWLPTTALTVR